MSSGGHILCKQVLFSYRKPKSVIQNVKNGHKHPNISHNYHDENHNEIEFYEVYSKRSTWWHSTPEQRTPNKQSHRLWWGASDQYTMLRGTYIHSMI